MQPLKEVMDLYDAHHQCCCSLHYSSFEMSGSPQVTENWKYCVARQQARSSKTKLTMRGQTPHVASLFTKGCTGSVSLSCFMDRSFAYMILLVLSEGSRKVCLHPGVSERPPPHLAGLHIHHAASADCGWGCHHQVLDLKDHVLHSHQSYLGHDGMKRLLPINATLVLI